MQVQPWLRRAGAAVLLTALLAVSSGAAALAATPGEPHISRDQAVAIARKAFAIPAELGEPQVSLSQSSGAWGESSTWSLNWAPKEGQAGDKYYIAVQADTGEITSYNLTKDPSEQPPLTYTRDEAQKRADALIATIAPTYATQVQLHQEPLALRYFYPGDAAIYSFNYERLYKDIPVQGQGITVSVDGRSGDVIQYSLNWDPKLSFDEQAQPIDSAAAHQAWQQALKVEPAYVQVTPPGKEKPEWRLVYRLRNGNVMLDAATGKPIDWSGQPVSTSPWSSSKPLPQPEQPYVKPAQPLSRDQAVALVKALIGGDLPDPNNVSYSDSDTAKTYSFNWSLPDTPEAGWQTNYYATVDAVRGVLTSFGHNQWQQTPVKGTGEVKESDLISVEKAHAAAVAFVLKARPDLAPSLKESPEADVRPWCRWAGDKSADPSRPLCTDYSLSLQYFSHDIAVVPTSVSVGVDLKTGQVSNFWAGQEPGQGGSDPLPAPELKVSATDAQAAYLKSSGLRLVWNGFSAPSPKLLVVKGGAPQPPVGRLVYVAANPQVTQVDSQTGHALDDLGRDLTRLSTRPSDIAGHFAQKEIELLLTRGVMTAEDGRFNPEGTVTRGEAAQMLVLAKGQRPIVLSQAGYAFGDLAAGAKGGDTRAAAAAPYVEAAVRSGIIRPGEEGPDFRADDPITREQFALWAARAMDYGAVAAMQTPIALNYRDADQIGARYKNAVALLAGLNVLHGDPQGNFRPQDQLRRGEAAVFLFAVMSERRSM